MSMRDGLCVGHDWVDNFSYGSTPETKNSVAVKRYLSAGKSRDSNLHALARLFHVHAALVVTNTVAFRSCAHWLRRDHNRLHHSYNVQPRCYDRQPRLSSSMDFFAL